MKTLFCALALATCAAAGALAGSGPSFWTIATSAEFLKGTSDGVFVSAEGVLRPGLAVEEAVVRANPDAGLLDCFDRFSA